LEPANASGNNKLKGTVPTVFGTMASLTEFDMSGNELHGSLPSEFGDLSTLNILRVPENNLDGLIPSELGKLDETLEILEMGTYYL
jgi:Leucine-rich repeat (LRR) protein